MFLRAREVRSGRPERNCATRFFFKGKGMVGKNDWKGSKRAFGIRSGKDVPDPTSKRLLDPKESILRPFLLLQFNQPPHSGPFLRVVPEQVVIHLARRPPHLDLRYRRPCWGGSGKHHLVQQERCTRPVRIGKLEDDLEAVLGMRVLLMMNGMPCLRHSTGFQTSFCEMRTAWWLCHLDKEEQQDRINRG